MKRDPFEMPRCKVPGVEAVGADTHHRFPRHTHEQFGMGVIDCGGQRSWSGRGYVEAGPGDMITVNPGEVHDGAPIGDEGRSWRMLYIDPVLITDALHEMTAGKVSYYEFSEPVFREAAAASRFNALYSLLTTGKPLELPLAYDERLLLLLSSVMDHLRDLKQDRLIPKDILKAKGLIDDDPTTSATLADLARKSGLSRYQVLRGFMCAIGLTPHAYLVQRRIDMARRLIGAGIPLAEAATASGFADQSHMTRIFRARYGVTPGNYARAVL